ncbi:MAG TPA: DUF6152 family protein [Gammaproteobacteria bacterium]|nr:DUF6152 family protein [Gammaproteobacteria bacterium]
MTRATVFLGLFALAIPASAHHSAFVHFDKDDVVEVAGELESIQWRNPHTEMVIRAIDSAGAETLWLGQERGAALLARKGVTQDMLEVGEAVRVAGFRGRTNRTSLFVTNIMLADGREIYNESFAQQRWDASLAGTTMAAAQAEMIRDRPVTSDGLFRVWSTPIAEFRGLSDNVNLDRALWNDSYPLTDYAKRVRASWDPIADNPFIFCQNGMPAIMDQLHPMEFVRDGEDILIRLEEQDAVRRVHMSEDAPREGRSPYGHSTGRWDGAALVVTTTDIDWPWFDQDGIPQSDALVLVERFTPSPDGFELDYTVTATDPAVFTEPVVLNRTWIWAPGEELQPFNCEWDGSSLQPSN